jgi:transposase
VAELFDIGVASVVKWSQRARETGSAAAKPMGGKRPYLLEGERYWLLARFAAKPGLTLQALLGELAERGIGCHVTLALPQARRHQLQKNRLRDRAGSS